MATTSNPLDAIASMIDPSLQVNQMAIDRQRALAAALQQQSMTPADGQMISGHYVAPSWTQFAGKIAQGLSGKSMNDQLDQQQIAYNRQTMQAMAQLLQGGGQQSSSAMPGQLGSGMMGDVAPQNGKIIPDQPTQQQQGGPTGNGNFGYDNVIKGKIIAALGGEGAGNAFWKSQELPEAVKTNNYYGLDKASIADAMNRENAAKGLMNLKPEGTVFDAARRMPIFTAPDPKQGGFTTWDNGVPSVQQIAGADTVRRNMAAAEKQGANQETVAPKDILPTLDNGQVVPQSIDATLHPANRQGLDLSKLSPQAMAYLQKTNPEAFANGVSDFGQTGAAPQGVGARFGQQQGAEYGQKEMSNSFDALKTDNRQAQTTISYLQSIKSLADKAGVGGFSDKTQLTNNLLSYAGISEKATNAVSAKNLLDKYSNQITARLGGGSNGSDARSAIIASAYPNSKMTPAAIKEAVDNLVSANQMTQAKAQLLTPHGNARDPVAYSQKEQIFDRNADPRIWQYKSIQDPKARAAFASKIMQQDPQFPAKIQALEKIGAF